MQSVWWCKCCTLPTDTSTVTKLSCVVHHVQALSNGCSRWSRYLNDNTDAADAECDDDDDDRLSAKAYRANQTASTAERFRRKEAGSRYVL